MEGRGGGLHTCTCVHVALKGLCFDQFWSEIWYRFYPLGPKSGTAVGGLLLLRRQKIWVI